jgi:hypothetical protein
VSAIPNHPEAREGETAYEWYDDKIVFQRDCDGGCDRGLIFAPVRDCPKCGGSGYLMRFPWHEVSA